MPHKPLRQLAAEKARGNKPANPSQLGDPIDLKAETSDGEDPVESPSAGGGDNIGRTGLDIPRASLEGGPDGGSGGLRVPKMGCVAWRLGT
ncbi:predicted protein [Chaetomium globosum CBS 148.51]|uniref:Uncharacterized protein n=1 Tax=Chaetomium globosum (strain ATCC 6205 / CBS 148.51 / DSM 1962 / NBRC 6347 / NRRL 1970) TaxID=306901 RepID=Q2GX33_CHAGB|nr:uncharacterized protein CHGG_07471 [Chaetomium globosum CBS 148.51]EAQ86218.1 predicted protein [Chaetomium globosum CBS 148.51]